MFLGIFKAFFTASASAYDDDDDAENGNQGPVDKVLEREEARRFGGGGCWHASRSLISNIYRERGGLKNRTGAKDVSQNRRVPRRVPAVSDVTKKGKKASGSYSSACWGGFRSGLQRSPKKKSQVSEEKKEQAS